MGITKRNVFDNVRLTSERDPEKEPLLKTHGEPISTKKRSDTDTGRAWLVALGLFFLNFMVLGMARMNSVLFVNFMDVFHVSRKTASTPYSIQQATARLFGPVAGFLGQRFGISAICIFGALVASISSAACYFARDMTLIIILWGGVYGFGIALTGPVKLILIDQNFAKYKSSASGFVFSGTSVGSIFFPAVLSIVYEKYGINGMFLLMGSIILFAIPIAMLLREKTKSNTQSTASYSSESYSSLSETEECFPAAPKNISPADSDTTTFKTVFVKFIESKISDGSNNEISSQNNPPTTSEPFIFKAVPKSIEETLKTVNYGSTVNFKPLHENTDLVFCLLAGKIPLTDEVLTTPVPEITQRSLESSAPEFTDEKLISYATEIIQCYLESPDTEFISKELRKLEYYFQLPDIEVQQFLIEIQEKLKKFNELINADRNQFLKQNFDIEDKALAYKNIHSRSIIKSDGILEIFEYCLEVPSELYIPIKLQTLNGRTCAYVVQYYSSDERIFELLKQLKKLNKVFNAPVRSLGCSSESNLLKYTSLRDANKSDTGKDQTEKYENTFKNQIKTALKVHTNPMFLVVCLSRGLFALSFLPVVTSVVDFTRDHGMLASDGVYAIVVLYVGDLIGRLCTGWITDKGFLSEKNYMVVALMLLCISTATLPFMSGIAMLLPALGIFALLQGSLFMKHPIMLMKYLKRHEKYIGLGFMSFFAGLMGLIIPHYIGYFRDYLGSYDQLLYINGSLAGFVGCLWILEPFFTRFVPLYREKDATSESY